MHAVNATPHITAIMTVKGNIGKQGTRENANNCKKNMKRNWQQQGEKSRTMCTIELVIVFSCYTGSVHFKIRNNFANPGNLVF